GEVAVRQGDARTRHCGGDVVEQGCGALRTEEGRGVRRRPREVVGAGDEALPRWEGHQAAGRLTHGHLTLHRLDRFSREERRADGAVSTRTARGYSWRARRDLAEWRDRVDLPEPSRHGRLGRPRIGGPGRERAVAARGLPVALGLRAAGRDAAMD